MKDLPSEMEPLADQDRSRGTHLEPVVPAPVTDPERLADPDLEEALFRRYWATLPDKPLARRTWPSEVQWYCERKGLTAEIMPELVRRCQDLRRERS